MGRLTNFLKRPDVALWGTVTGMLFYVLSIGPAAWLLWHIHLPRWASDAIFYVFSPLEWLHRKSEVGDTIVTLYIGLWFDPTAVPATPSYAISMPQAPPHFVEAAGILIAAWLIWNFVRWVNQLKTPSSA